MINYIILALCMLFVSLSTLADTAAAKVVKAQGKATAVNAANQERPLNRGDDIFAQDTVITPKGTFLTMRFTDGSVVDLGAETKYVIKDYNYSNTDPKQDKFSTEVVEGGFRAITGNIGSRSPGALSTKARLTTLTVRGTAFYLMAPPCSKKVKKTGMSSECDDITQFTLSGLTSVTYEGKEYVLGPTATDTTFELSNGQVNLSNKIPTSLPVAFSSGVSDFMNSAGAGNLGQNPGAGGGGGGGGSSPCGTLNAVGGALPSGGGVNTGTGRTGP